MKGGPILFRADASHAIGVGHLARIAALVDECKAQGREAIVHAGGDFAIATAWLHDHGIVNRSRSRRATSLLGASNENAVSAVVIDGPALVQELVPRLLEKGTKVVVLDDAGGMSFPVDTVVNHNFHAPTLAEGYRAQNLLLGRPYALLRNDIRRLTRGSCRPQAGARLRIVVTCGGSDPAGATSRLVRAIAALPASTRRLDAVVLAGPAFRDDVSLRSAMQAAHRTGHTVDLHRSPADPGALFVTSDAALCSAGGTLGELAYLGCPALAFAIVPDQWATAAAQAEAGVIVGGQELALIDDEALVALITRFVTDDALRADTRQRALATIDGAGARRVIASL